MPKKILCVVGARPNLIKMAPILRAFERRAENIYGVLIHTGQHYDHKMNHRFFEDLGLPWPAVNLEVGSAGHITQIANVMLRFEPVLLDEKPDAVLVVGDVNSTLACGIVANRYNIPLIHVEAGLRSFDRQMPEEINRLLVDQLADLLFITEPVAAANLAREGVAANKVRFVGNVMIDSLLTHLAKAVPIAETLRTYGITNCQAGEFGLVTLHRPSNVDDRVILERMVNVLETISQRLPLVFPLHPRTRGRLGEGGIARLTRGRQIHMIEPLGYLEMLGAIRDARIVLTDSGGVQEETTALGVPCVTLRNNTERPVTVDQGTNYLVGVESEAILTAVNGLLDNGAKVGRCPELWDGHAADRIAEALIDWF